jgi:hypothetical protein
MSIFGLIEKLLALLVVVPPVYLIYRFVRWYLRQRKEDEAAG